MEIRKTILLTCKGCIVREKKIRAMSIEMDNLSKRCARQVNLIQHFKNLALKYKQELLIPKIVIPKLPADGTPPPRKIRINRKIIHEPTDPLNISTNQKPEQVDKSLNEEGTFKIFQLNAADTIRIKQPIPKCSFQQPSKVVVDNKKEGTEVKGLTYIHVYTKTPDPSANINRVRKMEQRKLDVKRAPIHIENHTVVKPNLIHEQHLNSALFLKPFKCGKCEESFEASTELSSHMQEAHPKFSYSCVICRIILNSQKGLADHMKTHASNVIHCEICGKDLKGIESETHLCSTDDQQINCEYCEMTLMSTMEILGHLKSHKDNIKMYKCSKCSKFFKLQVLVRYHEQQHANDEPSQKRKRSHLESNPERTKLCDQCGKSFFSEKNLSIHLQSHGEPKIKCPECPQMFHRELYLQKHSHIHRNVKYTCQICDYSGSTPNALTFHMTLQHNSDAEPVQCDICERKYKNKQQLHKHMKRHRKNLKERFECEFCDTSYKYKGDLNRHLRVHLGENIYKCGDCEMSFKHPLELQKHSFLHYKEEQEKTSTVDSE